MKHLYVRIKYKELKKWLQIAASQKNRKNPNDPARFLKKQSFTDNGELAEDEIWQIDQEVIEKEAMYDGFYAVVTNLDDDVQDIIAIDEDGRLKNVLNYKSDFDADPFI